VRLASFLISVAVAVAAYPAGPLGATGLYTDPHSFFFPIDSTRAIVVIRQSEFDLGPRRASLLSGDLLIRPRPRFEVRIGLRFPALRDHTGIRYGVGDLMLLTTARIAGDSTGASGLFARADAWIPTGSDALRPFSDASFESDGGLEARFTARSFSARAVGLYSLAVGNRRTADFSNEEHITLAASIGAKMPFAASVETSAFYMRFDDGEEREMYAVSLARELSPLLLFELSGAVEAGSAGSRVFDSSVSVSFAYRFPPRQTAPRPDSTNP
jgi:hypothetical protein